VNLLDLIHRTPVPAPWSEGEKIPWSDPAFSERMLREHLSQEHDAASRRSFIIDQHVDWIYRELLGGNPTRVLDLGCGPGLYTSRLARLGHCCVGVDYGPASVRYARETATRERLACTYIEEDVRRAEVGTGFGLVMMLFGEFNVFSPADVDALLNKAHAALAPDGWLLLEPHTFAAVREEGLRPCRWSSHEQGLFSERPHLYLEENFWDEAQRVATTRYYIVDAATGQVTRHAAHMQAYTNDEYSALLRAHGFVGVRLYPSLGGQMQEGLLAIAAQKRAGAEQG
jgi:SAM-dependent methyltransferase